MTGATSSARSSGPRPSFRRLPDRRRGGRARQEGQAQLPAAPVDAEGRRCRPRLLCLRPAGRPGRGHPQAAQHRAQGAARGAAQGVSPPILYGDHVIGKGEALFDAICKEGGEGIISKKAKAPYKGERSTPQLAQGQMHPAAGIRHRRLAGQRQAPRLPLAPPGAATAASSNMPARSAPASTPG
jgi:hypothetical protein